MSEQHFSTERWIEAVWGNGDAAAIRQCMRHEPPASAEVLVERTCNLHCWHCYRQAEAATRSVAEDRLPPVVRSVVDQLPTVEQDPFGRTPQFSHNGYILQPWQVPMLQGVRRRRPDVGINVVDNGSFLSLVPELGDKLRVDDMNISLDGMRDAHNRQRNNERAFDVALDGLRRAPAVADHVSSIMTLTTINYLDVEHVGTLLLGEGLADFMVANFMSPTQPWHWQIETGTEEVSCAWHQCRRLAERYNHDRLRFCVAVYRAEDLRKIADVVGPSEFRRAVEEMYVNPLRLVFNIQGVRVHYKPLSTEPTEGVLLDVDGSWRTPYFQQFTLAELDEGVSEWGSPTGPYTAYHMTPSSNVRDVFHHVVEHWWKHFGRNALRTERELLGGLV